MRVVSLLLLVLVAAPAVALVTRPLAGRAIPPALRLRGGLGDIDPTMVAKVATGLSSANAVFVALAPDKAGQAYGVRVGGLSSWLLEFCGHTLVASVILAAASLAGLTLKNALAWSLVPYSVFVLQGILQGRPAKHGTNVVGQYLILAINVFMMYTCWTSPKYADNALKGYNAWGWLNAVLMAAIPSIAAKSWGITGATETDLAFVKTMGWYIGIMHAMLLSLLQGNSAVVAVGHGWLVCLIAIIDGLFISKTTQKLGGDTGPMYAWLILGAAVPAFTLL